MSVDRTKTDSELKAIIETFNESELTGLMFGLFPHDKTPRDLTKDDCVRMMELNPKGHY